MAISLTESAASRVRNYLGTRGKGVGLRLGVTKTGCSGYSYVINYADDIAEDDVVFEDKGVKLVVDPEALPLIDGTEVDWHRGRFHQEWPQ
jgi:iron-sulfur cluster assembly protein